MSDYDADVALAISLSLQEQKGRVSNPHDDPIVISDSSDEEEETDRLSKNASTARASGSKSIPKPLPSRKPATSLSKRLDDPSNIIDLDTTLEIEDIDTDTQHEDTATEDESDDEPAIASTKNRRKRETTSVSSSQVKTSSAANRSKSAAPNSFLAGKDTVPTPALSPMTAFRTERAKMEQERIARLKRLRPQTEKRDRISDGEETDDSDRRPSKRPSPALTSSSADSSSKGKGKPTTPKGSFNVPDKSGLFWYGAVRQTANKHVTPSQDTKPIFRLTEILPPPNAPTSDPDKTLSFVILASYSTDLPWLYGLFSPDVPVILVAQPGQDGRAEVHHALPNWVRASPALAGGRGCMHVKMMLLFYKSGRLRVVIPTGNFLPHDWRDIENSVWLQDVPLRTGPVPVPAPIPSASQLYTDATQSQGFGERLEFVLKGLNVAPALEAHLIDQRASGEVRLPLRNIGELHARWDWSLVIAYLVPSIAGRHTGWPAVLQVGHTALMKAIRDMGAASDKVKIECQGSSIGSYSTAWTNEFMSSARGVSPEKWLDTPKAHRSKVPHPLDMKIVFPSLSTVDQSALGRPGGGTIFCQRRQWDASTFPKELFVDSNSKRGKVLMHSKMILGLVDGEERNPKGWLYVGSHNFTPSAWGNLSGSGFTPIMNITNYELGVVIALDKSVQGDELVCWKRPPRAYVKGKDLPWMQTEHM